MILRLRTLVMLLASIVALPFATSPAQGETASIARVRVITSDFVLPGRLHKLAALAAGNRTTLDHQYVETAPGHPVDWIKDMDLVILDTPRPMDMAKVEQRIGNTLRESKVPWMRIGGGPPAFGNLPPPLARSLLGYYTAGGDANARAMFAFIAAWRSGADTRNLPPPTALPSTGFYHPEAPRVFSAFDDYWQWGQSRWKDDAARMAIIVHAGVVSGMETQVVDAMIAAGEAKGLVPIVFWFDAVDPQGLERVIGAAGVNALVIATHLQNGPARAAEFLKLGIPVLQAISYREGSAEAWAGSHSGMSQHLIAPFLALPETWGVSDPIVTDAIAGGAPAPIAAQIESLIAKVARLAVLRRKPARDKRLALMFWNYPPGEKNLSAAHLNVPKSLEKLSAALARAGYTVEAKSEADFIRSAQAMLEAVYRPDTVTGLLEADLAAAIPLERYYAWLDDLPSARRAEVISHWGQPESDPGVREIKGQKQFVIPRLQIGNLVVMPQLPRSGQPGAHYHDMKEIPGHLYLAAYLYVREVFGADALIHFGTHGTQEWTPGKDRGLSVSDYPYLAIGDMPVFYPYIQDNVAEAIQAKRRGRAVTISHQTPPFAPAGLYDELRDLNLRMNEFAQLDEGAVRDRTASEIRKAVIAANLHRDMHWSEERMEKEFPAFFSDLYDHMHVLSKSAMPLGLHTFGQAAAAEHRISTVMQQLGEPFYRRLGLQPDEVFLGDFKAQQASRPYTILHRHLRENVPIPTETDAALRADLERAVVLDRALAETGEIEALLEGLAGRFVAPGAGGDPIRNPDVPSGRNLFAFEPDKVPTKAAYDLGGKALQELIEIYQSEHNGERPTKLAFSVWASETMRNLGLVEAQILHALGLRPVWNQAGRVVALDIIPRKELGRPRIDTVLQVTSVYRDQFDGFMRLLAEAIERLSALDEADNPIAQNTAVLADKLTAPGRSVAEARQLGALRIFSNAPGDYGTNLPDATLRSTTWEKDDPLAEGFLSRLQFAYGVKMWGTQLDSGNLFAEQLRGTQAAVLSRSSKLHGVLSTDHPFEYLGGLALAIRHLDGKKPSLYISDFREQSSWITSAARFLAEEMRTRVLNPHWISGMQKEGYAGTLELLNATNNLWGWQVTAPDTVRADQWQAVHDTFVNDSRQLGLNAWFEQHNPTAQAQVIERLIEAIRKGYWDASQDTRQQLVERWRELAEQHGVNVGEPETQSYIATIAEGFGSQKSEAKPAVTDGADAHASASKQVRGAELRPVTPEAHIGTSTWHAWLGLGFIVFLISGGAFVQLLANARLHRSGAFS